MLEDISKILPSIETRTQVETRRVDPLLALFIELDTLNITLLRVLESLNKTRPQGKIFPISRVITSVVDEEELAPSWFGFHLVNDGPSELEFSVNDHNGPFCTLPAHETLDVDMIEASINALYFRSGGTANIRVYGVY